MKNEINLYAIEYKLMSDEIAAQNQTIKRLSDNESLLKDENDNIIRVSTLFVSESDFHKIYLRDFASIIGLLGNADMKVFAWILENVNYSNVQTNTANTFVATYDEIAKEVKTSKATVMRTIKNLEKTNCIDKIANKTYRLNPNLLSIGKKTQQQKMQIQFNNDLIKNLEVQHEQSKSNKQWERQC